MLKKEWQSFLKNHWLVIVIIGVMSIPTLYTTIFLGSMWDPYGTIDQLPVAVVNLDQAVTYQDQKMNLGEEMVSSLKEDASLDFHFTDEASAQKGLEDGTYYMVITIPENFSSNATTLLNEHPQKMELEYQTNPGTNYIASKMDETAINKIKSSISTKVTETYANTLFNQIRTVGNGFHEAADGAAQINDGTAQLTDGNTTITDNLEVLATSSLTFKDGANTLNIGLKDYTGGVSQIYQGASLLQGGIDLLNQNNTTLNDGVASLDAGISQLKLGSDTLLAGLNQMSESLGDSLTPTQMQNIALLKEQLPVLNEGIQALYATLNDTSAASPMATVNADLAAVGTNAQEAGKNLALTIEEFKNSDAFKKLDKSTQNELLAALTTSTSFGALSTNLNSIGTHLNNASTALTTVMNSLQENVKTIAEGANMLLPGSQTAIDQLSNGLVSVKENLDKEYGIIQGCGTINQGLTVISSKLQGQDGLQNGLTAYTDGVAALKEGSQALVSGAATLNANTPALLTGTNQLSDGASAIHDGAALLKDGSQTLGEGLSTIADGSKTLATSLNDGASQVDQAKGNDQTTSMFAEPVKVQGSELSAVPNNGHAMAPYMMSVGLYVGCIAFCLMYPLLKHSTPSVENGFKWWLSKASVIAVVACLQACLMVGMLMMINHLEPLQILQTFLMACLVSTTFMAMIVFFNLILGKVGSFIVLVFMVLQLGGAAGTYPIELSAGFFKAIHPYMPFTYSVHAFRNTLCIGGNILNDVGIFVVILIAFALLTYIVYEVKARKLPTIKNIEA